MYYKQSISQEIENTKKKNNKHYIIETSLIHLIVLFMIVDTFLIPHFLAETN